MSVSILIFFLNKLYVLHIKATDKPTQGNDEKLINKYIVAIITNDIEITLFLFNFSFKKMYPKNTLRIGKIK